MIEIYEVLVLIHNLRNQKAAFPSKRPDKAERGDASSQVQIKPLSSQVNFTHPCTWMWMLWADAHTNPHVWQAHFHLAEQSSSWRLVHMKSVQPIESFMYRHHVTYSVVKGGKKAKRRFPNIWTPAKIHIIEINAFNQMGTNTQSVVNTMWPNVKLENEQVQLEKNMLVQTERWAYRNTQEGSTQHPCWQSWTRLLRSNETLFSRGDRGQRSREPKHMPRVANRDRGLIQSQLVTLKPCLTLWGRLIDLHECLRHENTFEKHIWLINTS